MLLTFLAMLVYPGGAVYDRDATRYLFFRNFFSDLGATMTPSGRPNLVSHILLIIALGTVGIALILASTNWKVIIAWRHAAQGIGLVSQAFEIIAGLGFIGIGATPWNLVLDAHNDFVRVAFGFLLAYDVCLLVIQLRNRWPSAYVATNAVYLLLHPLLRPRAGQAKRPGVPGRSAENHRICLRHQPWTVQALSIRREAGRFSRLQSGSLAA